MSACTSVRKACSPFPRCVNIRLVGRCQFGKAALPHNGRTYTRAPARGATTKKARWCETRAQISCDTTCPTAPACVHTRGGARSARKRTRSRTRRVQGHRLARRPRNPSALRAALSVYSESTMAGHKKVAGPRCYSGCGGAYHKTAAREQDTFPGARRAGSTAGRSPST